MINLADYNQGGMVNNPLFGSQSMDYVTELNKALDAQEITGMETVNLTTAGGAPLKVESLEKNLKVLTYSERQLVLWREIPRLAARNTVEEYNQLTSYGTDTGGFFLEGELPQELDSTYERRAALVKFIGVTKAVTHPMQLVETMVDGGVLQRTIKDGTLWVLHKLTRGLYYGDSTIVPQEFDGLYAQHAHNDAFVNLDAYFSSNVVIDCRGGALNEKNIQNATDGILENFGTPTDLFAPPKVLNDFVQGFYGNKFIQPNTNAITDGVMGQRVKAFASQFGDIELQYDLFANPSPNKVYNTAATSPNAPLAPTPDVSNPVTPVAATVADSKWASSDAGNYFFAVVARNRFGESAVAPLVTGSPAVSAIVANGSADLLFTNTTSTYPATGFTIYRSNKNPVSLATATFYPLYSISTAQLSAGYDGAAAGYVRDNNRIVPGTYQAFMIQKNEDCFSFKQLAPLMKMDLAVTSPAYRFMVLLYGTPILYAPQRMVRFINIAPLS